MKDHMMRGWENQTKEKEEISIEEYATRTLYGVK